MQRDDADLPAKRYGLWFAALAGLTALLYLPVLPGDPLLDDFASIDPSRNPSLLSLGQALHPPADSVLAGRPLANLSFALNLALTGDSLAAMRAVNLVFHLLAGALLWQSARLVLRERLSQASGEIAALAFAGLWLVHPVHVASVGYLAQRTEVLMGFFLVASVYCALRAREADDRRRTWIALGVGAVLAGAGCKEGIVVAPLVALGLDCWLTTGGWREVFAKRRALYLAYGVAALTVLALYSQTGGRGIHGATTASLYQTARTQGWAVIEYLSLSFWPHPLCLDRGTSIFAAVQESGALRGVLAMLLFATGVWLAARKHVLGVLIVGFFLLLAVTTSFLVVERQPLAENRLYLPVLCAVGAVIAAAGALPARLRAVALGLCFALAAGATGQRTQLQRDGLAFWKQATVDFPQNSHAHAHLALQYAQRDRFAEAEAANRASLALRSDSGEVWGNLALALWRQGKISEVRPAFERALALPDVPTEHLFSAAAFLYVTRDYATVEGLMQQVLQRRGESGEGYAWLALAALRQGKPWKSWADKAFATPGQGQGVEELRGELAKQTPGGP